MMETNLVTDSLFPKECLKSAFNLTIRMFLVKIILIEIQRSISIKNHFLPLHS